MSKKKYQIFVSSTYEDLKAERSKVIQAILEMDHIPIGMEMFSAGNEGQWKLIQRQIDEADYYIVIVGHKYGSMDGLVSYTEKEYDYAIEKEIPVLGFVIKDTAKVAKSAMESDPEIQSRLVDFKSKVKSKICSFWTSEDDLYGAVAIALNKQMTAQPRIGWVRASESMSPEVASEITRLNLENQKLINQLKTLQQKDANMISSEFDKAINSLRSIKIKISFMYTGETEWTNSTEFSLFKIFELLSPKLLTEITLIGMSYYIGFMWNPDKTKTIRPTYPTPENTVQHIMETLHAFQIVEPSKKKHSAKDTNEYWSLTGYGKELNRYAVRKSLS